MPKITNELATIEDDTDKMIRTVSSSVDLTLIFNRHADAADAEDSVSHIEPDSIVFIEGYVGVVGEKAPYAKLFSYLTSLRMTVGKNHPSYVALKQAILEDIAEMITTPQRSYSDFSQHRDREIQLLLEKDCLIEYADYEGYNDSDKLTDTEIKFVGHAERANRDTFYETAATTPNFAKTLVAMRKEQDSKYVKHTIRETYAIAAIYTLLGKILTSTTPDTDLAKSDSGKLKAYVTYGTAHAHSLTEKLTEYGTDPNVIIAHEIPEHSFLEKSTNTYLQNRARRLAHSTLTALKSELFLSENVDETAELYRNLAPINDDSEAQLKIFIQCLQINQLAHNNTDDAILAAQKWITNVYSDVMSNARTT